MNDRLVLSDESLLSNIDAGKEKPQNIKTKMVEHYPSGFSAGLCFYLFIVGLENQSKLSNLIFFFDPVRSGRIQY